MQTANVHEAKTKLSRLLDAAASGEEVVITRRSGGTITRFLVTVAPDPDRAGVLGALAGQIHYAVNYDEADAEIAAMFDAATGG